MNPTDHQALEHFVRSTLGCQCPDDVFQSIVIGPERTPDGSVPFTRLLVGHRLLIYIVPTSAAAATPDTLAALARQGRAERDTQGYNRFRLVVSSPDPAAESAAARAIFEQVVGHDDKAHLHVVTSGQIPMAIGFA